MQVKDTKFVQKVTLAANPGHEMLVSSDRGVHLEDGIMAPALLTLIPHKFLGNVVRHHPKMY